jgi:hypothetical protein
MSESIKISTKAPEAKRENTDSQARKTQRYKSVNSHAGRILFLQRTIGNQAVQRLYKSGFIQTKLRIGQPNDKYEQEADRVADKVMRTSELEMQRQIEPEEEDEKMLQTTTLTDQITPLVQEQVEEEKEEEEVLQTKGRTGYTAEVAPNLESRIRALRGGGQPLSESNRSFMERRFGIDFSGVRLYTDSNAAQMSKELDAEAFTYGRDIYFGAGRYNPRTLLGKRLLAHELTHVVQQGSANRLSDFVKTGLESRGKTNAPGSNAALVQKGDSHSVPVIQLLGGLTQVPAGLLVAQAFTWGSDIYFKDGKHDSGSSIGKGFFAHELAHTVQQSETGVTPVQRKIQVGKKILTRHQIPKKYRRGFGGFGKELIEKMHKSSSIYAFDKIKDFQNEVLIRYFAKYGVEKANRECCSISDKNFYLDRTYWNKESDTPPLFKVKPESVKGNKGPADAVKAIFKRGAKTVLECDTMAVAIQYYALVMGLGEEEFNRRFPGGKGIVIRQRVMIFEEKGKPPETEVHPIGDEVSISSIDDILPGDWIYFRNIPDYRDHNPGGHWSGEWTVYLGNGKFKGFLMPKALTTKQMHKELLRYYNMGAVGKNKVYTVKEAIKKTKRIAKAKKEQIKFGRQKVAYRPANIYGK